MRYCSVCIALLACVSIVLLNHGIGIRVPIVNNFASRLAEEFRFHKSSLEQYKYQISGRITKSIEKVKADQEELKNDAQRELDSYIAKFNDLYLESVASLKKQREHIDDLNQRLIKYYKERPRQIDESLDGFRKFFNESQLPELPKRPISKAKADKQILSFKQLDDLNNIWKSINSKLLHNNAINQPKNAEEFMKGIKDDLEQMQDDFKRNVKSIEQKSIVMFKGTKNKQDVRLEKQFIDDILFRFDRDASLWIEEKLVSVDEVFKSLQEMVVMRESVFSALAIKKSANLQYTVMTDITMSQVLKLIDQKESAGWKLVKTVDGISVYRQFTGSKYACVKCEAVLGVSAEKIMDLFEDQSRMKEYNTLFSKGEDVEVVAKNTKVLWSSSEPIYIMKPRDFCSLVHVRKLKDGTVVVLQRAIEHPDVPHRPGLVRGEITLGANIIQPIPGKPNTCKVTMITQVDPGGFSPPVVINMVCAMGPVGYLKNLEQAACTPPSKAVLEEKRRLKKLSEKDPKYKPFKI